jgi:hypothetical protein
VWKISGVAPDGEAGSGADGETEGEDVVRISGVAPDGKVDGEADGREGEAEGEDVFMASPVRCGVRVSPSPGLSLVDLIRSPRRGDVLSDFWTGAATWTGDLFGSLLGWGISDRDRVVASGTIEPA